MRFKHAIVRKPGKRFSKCISSHPLVHQVDYQKALKQHDAYVSLLNELGLDIVHVNPSDKFADACFVEDNAVIHGNTALIARMGAEARRGEEIEVAEILKDYFNLKYVNKPGTLEGGDVLHIDGRYLISGITQRTNKNGVEQMKRKLDIEVKTMEDGSIVHLKSHVTYLGNNMFLTVPRFANHPIIETEGTHIETIMVAEGEFYAANSLLINSTLIMPAGYEKTVKRVRELGLDVETLNMSEFQKCEGALTCLSILF